MNCKSIITSFRPLTGIMVLIDTVHMTIIQPRLEFPSPYGDYGSYQYRVLDEYIDSWYGFPSPCGDYGSYHVHFKEAFRLSRRPRFRPLAGIMVLIGCVKEVFL